MTQDDLIEGPTKAQMVYSQVAGSGVSRYVGLVTPTTLRLPVLFMGYVDELAARAGVSRNHMLTQVIECGLDSIWSVMSDSDCSEISRAGGQRSHDLSKKALSVEGND